MNEITQCALTSWPLASHVSHSTRDKWQKWRKDVLHHKQTFFSSSWITSPDISIHNPRRNWHEPKHLMKFYSSATVVESTILFTTFRLLTTPHAILPKNTVMPLCEDPPSLFRKKASRNPTILNGLVSDQNWSFTGCDLSCLADLLRALTSPIVGEAAYEAHLENL